MLFANLGFLVIKLCSREWQWDQALLFILSHLLNVVLKLFSAGLPRKTAYKEAIINEFQSDNRLFSLKRQELLGDLR